ncbi:MAG: phosphatase domain-containing putative toxin [Candidatus Hodarchaeales archaeon]
MLLYWIDKNRFAGSSELIIENLAFLQDIRWGGIVSLQEEEALSKEVADILGVPFLHQPIPDFHVPSEDDIERIICFFNEHCLSSKKPLLVHCTAGLGRTGTVLASLLVKMDGIAPAEAIKRIREVNPLAIETQEQEEFIYQLGKVME